MFNKKCIFLVSEQYILNILMFTLEQATKVQRGSRYRYASLNDGGTFWERRR